MAAATRLPGEPDAAIVAGVSVDDAITELVVLATTTDDPELIDAYCDLAAESGHPNAQRVAGQVQSRTGDERRGAALLWRAFNGGLHWSLFELGEPREREGRLRAARKIYRRLADLGQHHALVKLAVLYKVPTISRPRDIWRRRANSSPNRVRETADGMRLPRHDTNAAIRRARRKS